MKKIERILTLLLFVIGVTLLSACSNDKDDEPDNPQVKQSYYTITADVDLQQFIENTNIQGTIDITCFEYNEKNEMVSYQNWVNVKAGSRKTFTANNLTKKITILLEITLKSGSITKTLKKYSVQVYYLQGGVNTAIKIDGTTRVSDYNPI